MPLQKLEFRPGLNREGTDYANEGGWYDGDKIRFRSGFPEKIGGWSLLSSATFIGTARSLWQWTALNGSSYVGVGTSQKYYIESGGAYTDITPYIKQSLVSNPFTATNGSSIITVLDNNYTPNVGDYIVISGAVSLGGAITAPVLNQEYHVVTSVSGTTYTIDVGVQANASDTGHGGSSVTISYEVPIGLDSYTTGTGWGAGPWGGSLGVTSSLGANPFTATLGSATVNVNQTAHGYTTGTIITIAGATAVRGIPAYNVNTTTAITYVDANNYTVTFASAATSNGVGGGSSVTVTNQPSGWGTGYTSSAIGQQLRLWTNDNYGQDLVIAPRGGAIYYWIAATGLSVRAQALSYLSINAGYQGQFVPTATNQVISSAIQKFVIAFGANSYDPTNSNTAFNPMLVRWSDQLNPYQWVPAVTNQSGEYALSNGSYIMGARATRQEILIWTDTAIYSMQYLGAPYVWGFNILMDNISVMSPNSMITINNVTYWMGVDKFYMYSGRVETLPCALRQYIYADININQAYQVFAGGNEGYNEVWWFYVSNESTNNTIDKYVIYNYVDRVWYYGTMARTAWLDTGGQYPVAADYNNHLLNHEFGVDDNSTSNTKAINAYVQSSDFDIGDGHNFGFVWRILPDVNFNGSNVNNPSVTMTVKPRVNSGTAYGQADNPTVTSADNFTNRGTYNIQQFTGQVYTRLRGRQLSFRIESNQIGCQWQLGLPRIDIRQDGRR